MTDREDRDLQFSRSLAIHVFEKKGVIIPGYADVIADYLTEDEDE